MRTGHDNTVDWWAVGVLTYELLFGVTPFFNKNRQLLTTKICNTRVVFPDRKQYSDIGYSDEVVDFIVKLLDKNRLKRLGAKNDFTEVLDHPWFSDIDLTKL